MKIVVVQQLHRGIIALTLHDVQFMKIVLYGTTCQLVLVSFCIQLSADFEDMSCEMAYGRVPPPFEEDPVAKQSCLTEICKHRILTVFIIGPSL